MTAASRVAATQPAPPATSEPTFGRGAEVTTLGGARVVTGADGRSTTIVDRGRVLTLTTTPDGRFTLTINGHETTDPYALHEAISRLATTGRGGREATFRINGRPLPDDDIFGMGIALGVVATAGIAVPAAWILVRRAMRRTASAVRAAVRDAVRDDARPVAHAEPRLSRIEQAVEAIAVEVERVAEAQRYSAKLLTERLEEPSVVAARRAPAPERVVTPH